MSEKKYVPHGVYLVCDKGAAPSQFSITFHARTVIYGDNMATEADMIPFINVKTFGVCAVTQSPCTLPLLKWTKTGPSGLTLGGNKLLLEDSELLCGASGKIKIFFTIQDAIAALPPKKKGILDFALNAVNSYIDFEIGLAKGLWKGLTGTVTGLYSMGKMLVQSHPAYMFLDPVGHQAALDQGAGIIKGLGQLAYKGSEWMYKHTPVYQLSNPEGYLEQQQKDIENGKKAWEWAKNNSAEDWGNITGQVLFEVLTEVVTGGGAAALTGAKVLDKVGDAARVANHIDNVSDLAKVDNLIDAADAAGDVGKVVKHGADDAATVASKSDNAASKCDGLDPVDIASGRVFSEVNEFTLPGPIPLVWNKYYYSDFDRYGALGYNGFHSYDVHHSGVNRNGSIKLQMPDGRQIDLPELETSTEVFQVREKFYWCFDGEKYSVRYNNGLTYFFQPFRADQGKHCLTLIKNEVDDKIEFFYSNRLLSKIIDSTGRILILQNNANNFLEKISIESDLGVVEYVHKYEYKQKMLVKTIDANDGVTTFKYAKKRMSSFTNTFGWSFHWEYDNKGRCVYGWGDDGVFEGRLRYDGNQTILTDSLGHSTIYKFNEDNQPQEIIDPLGNSVKYEYDEAGNIVSSINELGHKKEYEYDELGNLIAVYDELGEESSFIYDDKNRMVYASSPKGASTRRSFDEIGRVVEMSFPNGSELKFSYNEGKSPSVIEDNAGRKSELFYNNQGNLSKMILPNGGVNSMEYDYLGRMIKSTSPNGATTKYSYDTIGNLIKVEESDGNIHKFKYDAAGNLIEASDKLRSVKFSYGGMGGIIKSRTENGKTVHFKYDTEEQLKGIQNEHNEFYRFTRDPLGNIIGEWGFDGINRHYIRNEAGQVGKIIRPQGKYTAFKYDVKGNVISESYEDSSFNLFKYDADNQLIEATNQDNQVVISRDKSGRVIQESQNGYTVSSKYNKFNQRLSLNSSLGANIKNTYDDLGFLKTRSADQNNATAWNANFSYDILGNEIERDFGGNLKKRVERDAFGRVTAMRVQNRSLAGSSRKYVWSAGDQLQKIINGNGEITEFEYDQVGSLYSGSYGNGFEKIYKCPDAVGNLYKNTSRKDRKYGPSGKLLEDKEFHYKYNSEGFLIKKISKTESVKRFSLIVDNDDLGNKATWHYLWNANGSLKSVVDPSNKRSEYEYDALGRRTAKIIDKREINRYIYDGNVLLHEWKYNLEDRPKLSVAPDGNLNYEGEEPLRKDLLTTWIFDEGSFAPTAKLVGDKQYSIITDYLGTPVEAYDVSGKKVWDCQLDVYGKVRKCEGDVSFIPFRYQGQMHDVETGLYYNRFRYYDPEIGNYVSQDPIGLAGNNPNIYAYTRDVNGWVDPFGLNCKKQFKKKLNWMNRWVDRLTGKTATDMEANLLKKGWTKSNPQAATPAKIQHTVFTRTTKKGDTYILDYHPGAVAPQTNVHKTDYWKAYKVVDGEKVIYGRVGPTGFDNYDLIVDSPVFVNGNLVN